MNVPSATLTKRQMFCVYLLGVLRDGGPMTGSELAKAADRRIEAVRPRLSDLKDAGQIVAMEETRRQPGSTRGGPEKVWRAVA